MKPQTLAGAFIAAIITLTATVARAGGPLAYAHDDVTYGPDSAAAPVLAGGDTWGPGLAHDDTTYPEGPVTVVAADARLAEVAPVGHDDVTYPDQQPQRHVVTARRLAARSPGSGR